MRLPTATKRLRVRCANARNAGQLAGAVRDGSRWLVDTATLDSALADTTIKPTKETGGRRANGPARHAGG